MRHPVDGRERGPAVALLHLALEAGHHHHFLCRRCGQVEEVNLCLMEEVTQYVQRHLKARVESHFLQIEGLCARCSRLPGTPIPNRMRHSHKG